MPLTLEVSRLNATVTMVERISKKIMGVMLLALPSGIGPGAYAFTIIWNANQSQLKEPLDTSGGTLGFHGSLVANG